jgi:hypothetical protein
MDAADTFMHGRLANPTHPLWTFFESIHVNHQPTYVSKYPPMQGFALAFGRLIAGQAIVGGLRYLWNWELRRKRVGAVILIPVLVFSIVRSYPEAATEVMYRDFLPVRQQAKLERDLMKQGVN